MLEELEKYISTKEAAIIAKVSHSTASRLAGNGKWKAKKLGRNFVVLRSCAENHKIGKPGLKKGQKINRIKRKQGEYVD